LEGVERGGASEVDTELGRQGVVLDVDDELFALVERLASSILMPPVRSSNLRAVSLPATVTFSILRSSAAKKIELTGLAIGSDGGEAVTAQGLADGVDCQN
jgi:hypothetical protein